MGSLAEAIKAVASFTRVSGVPDYREEWDQESIYEVCCFKNMSVCFFSVLGSNGATCTTWQSSKKLWYLVRWKDPSPHVGVHLTPGSQTTSRRFCVPPLRDLGASPILPS